jgi:hypothetical protein
VVKGFGTKPYNQLRVSVISREPEPPSLDLFDYSAQFTYRWTHLYLHSTMVAAEPGGEARVNLGGANVALRLPTQGAGVAGVLIADPCVLAGTMGWIGCEYGKKLQTNVRTVQLINTFVPDNGTDFWGILGDNFYDRTGEITERVFQQISLEAKSKVFMSVPGNHDYWVLGSPTVSSPLDQCGNGHMQFYAQDAKAAEEALIGSSNSAPFNFSVDPQRGRHIFGCNIPDRSNAFWYNQVGNVGFVGQSGAYPLDDIRPFMQEACAWLSRQPGLDVAVLLGHWDLDDLGASEGMAMPGWYTEMAKLPGCAELESRGMLKFVMGHTHCNSPHPRGKVGAGFRVAGFGMEGCGNYGVPILDTTEDRVRFWYFDTSTNDLYDAAVSCVKQAGWRRCTHLATLWLDQPVARADGASRVLV